MSGTLGNIYNNISFALGLHAEALARLQEQVSTGSRINRVSDAPSAAYRILGLNSEERSLVNYLDNLSEVVSSLEHSSAAIGHIILSVVETKTRLTQITNGIYNQDGRRMLAEGINDTLEHVVLLANTERLDQYMFGGGNTTSAPYIVERTDGKITGVTYQGSVEGRNIELGSGVQVDAFYVGDNIFGSASRSDPVFLGDTGAEAGTGTSSVSGYTWLTVAAAVNEKQTITITGGTPTSGNINIAFGASAPLSVNVGYHATAADVETALETLGSIGSGDVTCTGGFLDDANGITIEFTGALALTNVAEMVVTDVDLDAGAPAISTDRDGGMQLSIDGGTAVGIPIGDKTNVAITNPDGKVLYVNAAGTISTGVNLVAVPGTHDIFNTLITIRDLLENERGLSDAQVLELLNDSFNSLDEINHLLVRTQVSIGSKISFLDNLGDSLKNLKYNTEDETTRLQEADIAQVAIDISRREVLYQMSLSVAARLMSMSLLNFLE